MADKSSSSSKRSPVINVDDVIGEFQFIGSGTHFGTFIDPEPANLVGFRFGYANLYHSMAGNDVAAPNCRRL
jgi:hypothetical protein